MTGQGWKRIISLMAGVLLALSVILFACAEGTLRPGDKGESVRQLQQRLTELGYDPGIVDGIYGSATTAAVKRFQKDNGLQADGIAGPKTQTALENTGTAVPTATAAPTASTTSYKTLVPGTYGKAVVRLQKRLKELGYLKGSVDGQYGPLTRKAVRSFQSMHGLEVTGRADPETQELLFSDAARNSGGEMATLAAWLKPG